MTMAMTIADLQSIQAHMGNPDREIVEIYRINGSSPVLGNGDIMQLPDLLPGRELPIAKLCPPIFERF